MKEISSENMIALISWALESMDTMVKRDDRIIFDCGVYVATVWKDGTVTLVRGGEKLYSYSHKFRRLYKDLYEVCE